MKNCYFTWSCNSNIFNKFVRTAGGTANGYFYKWYRRYNTAVNPKSESEAKELLKVTLKMRSDDSLRLDTVIQQEKLGLKHDNNVLVDAILGNIIGKENLIRDGNATATAATKYSGTQTITTDSYSGGYRLREVRNGVTIQTYNMQGGSSYTAAADFSDNDNNWTSGEYHDANQDDAALDVQWGKHAAKIIFNRPGHPFR
jgi:Zn-dependent metalloprotease